MTWYIHPAILLLGGLARGQADTASNSVPAPVPSVAATPSEGQDFIEDARLLFRVVACAGEGSVPGPLDAKSVAKYCEWAKGRMDDYKKNVLAAVGPYLASIRPATLPRSVVYPFGGGDLITALTTFPDAPEITTLSLEFAGDPRRLATLSDKTRLSETLDLIKTATNSLYQGGWNLSRNLKKTQHGEVPGQVANALIALNVHGMEPTSLRYFNLQPNGSLHYLSAADIAEVETRIPTRLKRSWIAPDWSEAFSNIEVRFRPRGGGPERVYRHIAANLDDQHFAEGCALEAHLLAKGDVAAMTRAASFLLWQKSFSRIRAYLTSHTVWMVSDSTGVPPPFARKAGLVQDTYGDFVGAWEPSDESPVHTYDAEFVALWKKNTHSAQPFRYGYPDQGEHNHMMVTRRPADRASSVHPGQSGERPGGQQ